MMRIDPFVRDLPGFQERLAESLESPDTRIYLDTSTLMWLARLSSDARAQFTTWCSNRSSFVPVWAAHELQRHLLSGTIRTNMAATVKETASSQRELVQLAAELADDALCMAKGFGLRSVYISEIQRLMGEFDRIKGVIEIDETRLRKAAEEVVSFVNTRLLGSDLDPMIADLSATGAFRLHHRVPPGYQDAHKSENSLGDAVIWREILNDVDVATRRTSILSRLGGQQRRLNRIDGVLISRDQKTDWVSTSEVRLANGDVVKADRELEQDVTLPHPLLGHEFSLRGGGEFFIVHPGALSGIVERAQKKTGTQLNIAAWRGASLRPDVLEKMLARAAQEEKRAQAMRAKARVSSSASSVPASPPITPQLDLGSVGPSDVIKGGNTTEITQYVGSNADDRTELLYRWVEAVKVGEMLPTKLGRILCGLVSTPHSVDVAEVSAVIGVARRLLPEFGNHIVLGAIGLIYFDETGSPRQQPLIQPAGPLLILEESPDLVTAFETLQRWIKDNGVLLPYLPGSKTEVVVKCKASAETKSVPATLQDLRVGSQSVLAEGLPADHPRLLSRLLGTANEQQCIGSTLLGLIAREYMLPISRVKPTGLDLKKKYSWGEDVGLQPVDTSAQGGIGELNSEDD